jgi:hypothetical protein
MRVWLSAIGLVAMATMAACSGPSTSAQDGYNYAEAHGEPSDLTPYGNSAMKQCVKWETTDMPKSDSPKQWEAGCEERIEGRTLTG